MDALHRRLHPPYIVGDFTESLCAGEEVEKCDKELEGKEEGKAGRKEGMRKLPFRCSLGLSPYV